MNKTNKRNKRNTGRIIRKLLAIANYSVLVTSWIILISGTAYAWGAGIHIVKGSYILQNLHLLLPSIAQLLRAFPRDFLYGCISADFFIGKGHKRRNDHCHNWSVGLKMLARTETPRSRAFCYGYLAHLAADVIAHNYFIPNQLYLTSSTKRIGHLYWEFRSDTHIEHEYWDLARAIVEEQNYENDASLEDAVRKKIFSLKTKKSMYVRALNLTDLKHWRRATGFVERNSRWEISLDYVQWLRNLSIALAVDFLHDPKNSVCLDYDPVGTRNILRAKRLRSSAKRLTGAGPKTAIFDIPDELIACDITAIDVHLDNSFPPLSKYLLR
jgi:hypothetical protein